MEMAAHWKADADKIQQDEVTQWRTGLKWTWVLIWSETHICTHDLKFLVIIHFGTTKIKSLFFPPLPLITLCVQNVKLLKRSIYVMFCRHHQSLQKETVLISASETDATGSRGTADLISAVLLQTSVWDVWFHLAVLIFSPFNDWLSYFWCYISGKKQSKSLIMSLQAM